MKAIKQLNIELKPDWSDIPLLLNTLWVFPPGPLTVKLFINK